MGSTWGTNMMMRLVILVIALISTTTTTTGFQQRTLPSTITSSIINNAAHRMNTVIDAPTKEDLERKVGRRSTGNEKENGDFLGDAEDNVAEAIRKQGPLEWLEDNPDEVREMDDPFHILVLDTTFEKPAITVPYL